LFENTYTLNIFHIRQDEHFKIKRYEVITLLLTGIVVVLRLEICSNA